MAKITLQTDMKKPLIIDGAPFPKSALPYLEKMGIDFKQSSIQSALCDYVFLDITITDLNTLQNIFQAGYDAGNEDGKKRQLSIECQALSKALLNLKTLAA
jgi:hypothetical protein